MVAQSSVRTNRKILLKGVVEHRALIGALLKCEPARGKPVIRPASVLAGFELERLIELRGQNLLKRPIRAKDLVSRSMEGLIRTAPCPASKSGRSFTLQSTFFRDSLLEDWPPLRPAWLANSWSREKLLNDGLTLKPPLRPALAASSRLREKLRFSLGTLVPPLRAMARCFSGSMEANPRVDLRGG